MAAAVKPRPTLDVTVPFNKLQVQSRIGRGSFATVYRARHVDWGCEVAFKKLTLQFLDPSSCEEIRMLKKLRKEAAIHMSLRHASIVIMMATVLEDDNYGFLLELVKYGSFPFFISLLTGASGSGAVSVVGPLLRTKLVHEVASGMSYLHSLRPAPIIHGDLKLQNILIADHFTAKISDFGLSKWKACSVSSSAPSSSLVGTATHVPPERWVDYTIESSESGDVYSFGILLWELLSGDRPFDNCKPGMLSELVVRGTRPPLDRLPPDTPSSVAKITAACWRHLPVERPTFSEILREFEGVVSGLRAEADIQSAKIALHKHLQEISNEKSVPSSDPKAMQPHAASIERARSTLVASLRRVEELTAQLYQNQWLRERERQLISAQLTLCDRAELLLDVMGSKPPPAYQSLLVGLRDTGQGHLVSLLTSPDSVWAPRHRQTLLTNYTLLLRDIQGTELIHCLRQTGVLNDREAEELWALGPGGGGGGDYRRNERLLTLVGRTSEEQYECFLQALRESRHDHLYQALTDATAHKLITEADTLSKKGLQEEALGEKPGDRQGAGPGQGLGAGPDVQSRASGETLDSGLAVTPVVGTEKEGFVHESALLEVVEGRQMVADAVVLGSELFVLRAKQPSVEVYALGSGAVGGEAAGGERGRLTFTRRLPVPDLRCGMHLAACARHDCVYVGALSGLHRLCLSYPSRDSSLPTFKYFIDSQVGGGTQLGRTSWLLKDMPSGLSVTSRATLLVALYNCSRVVEYTTHGSWLREINLGPGMDHPGRAFELCGSFPQRGKTGDSREKKWVYYRNQDKLGGAVCGGREAEAFLGVQGEWDQGSEAGARAGLLVLSHAGNDQHRVCVVDGTGTIVHSYGGPRGTTTARVGYPQCIAVDSKGHVWVSEQHTARVRVFTPSLAHLGDIHVPTPTREGAQARGRHVALCLDERGGRLFVGEFGGRLLVTSCPLIIEGALRH